MSRKPKSPWSPGDRVILYIRVSKVGDRKDTLISPDVQIRQGKAWAKREGCIVVDVVQDVDKSGRDMMKRQLTNTIKRVGLREAEGIVVWKVSRWGRDVRESLNAVYDLHKQRGFIASTSENLEEIETPSGKLSLTMYLAMAQFQSDQIGETWSNILDRRRDLGLPPGGSPRFGYKRVPQGRDGDPGLEYQPDDVTGPWLAHCYREFIAGTTLSRLVAELNKNGVQTTRGSRWTYTTLIKCLDSGWGAGLLVDRRENGPRKSHPKDCDFSPGAHEPVIDELTWKRYVKKRTDDGVQPREKATNYKLGGLLYCASCNRKLSTRVSPKKEGGKVYRYRYYLCHRTARRNNVHIVCPAPVTISQRTAERLVYEWLMDSTESESAYDIAQAKLAQADRARADVEGIDAEVEKLKKRVAKATAKMLDADDEDEVESLSLVRDQTMAQLKGLKDKRLDLELLADDRNVMPAEAFTALIATWRHADPAQVNTSLRDVIGQIVVDRTENVEGDDSRVRVVPLWEVAI